MSCCETQSSSESHLILWIEKIRLDHCAIHGLHWILFKICHDCTDIIIMADHYQYCDICIYIIMADHHCIYIYHSMILLPLSYCILLLFPTDIAVTMLNKDDAGVIPLTNHHLQSHRPAQIHGMVVDKLGCLGWL